MRTVPLSAVKMPGQWLWALSGPHGKPDLIVTEVPPHLADWDVTNAAKSAHFVIGRGDKPWSQDVADAPRSGAAEVTYSTLLASGSNPDFRIALKPKMGRPPLNGDTPLSERVEVRMTPTQRYAFERAGGAAWLRSMLDREIANLT